jgi:hypothetical protein
MRRQARHRIDGSLQMASEPTLAVSWGHVWGAIDRPGSPSWARMSSMGDRPGSPHLERTPMLSMLGLERWVTDREVLPGCT